MENVFLDGKVMRKKDLDISKIFGLVRMQEVASTRIADFLMYHLESVQSTDPLCFVVGKGNNGANGIAAARILHCRGRQNVSVFLAFVEEMNDMAKEQLQLYRSFGGNLAPSLAKGLLNPTGIIIDALLGTGIMKSPTGILRGLITSFNSSRNRVLALDLPSGLQLSTGEASNPCVQATWTFNFHIPKRGQMTTKAKEKIGELWTADTGLTYTAWNDVGVHTQTLSNLYKEGPIRRIY